MADDTVEDEIIMKKAMAMLPDDTRSILNAFLEEKRNKNDSNINISENFGLSQFWYDDNTCDVLAKEAIQASNKFSLNGTGSIALLACPSVAKSLASLNQLNHYIIFEYDNRFDIYGGKYQFWDYNATFHDLPSDFKNKFDLVLCDPPYLSEECLRLTAETAKWLMRLPTTPIILNTGMIMENFAFQFLSCRRLIWSPSHSSKLSNQFASFANYPTITLGGYL